jgi:hypothetical protein
MMSKNGNLAGMDALLSMSRFASINEMDAEDKEKFLDAYAELVDRLIELEQRKGLIDRVVAYLSKLGFKTEEIIDWCGSVKAIEKINLQKEQAKIQKQKMTASVIRLSSSAAFFSKVAGTNINKFDRRSEPRDNVTLLSENRAANNSRVVKH